MERLFSPEEEIPNPDSFWTPPPPLPLDPHVVTGGVGGVGIALSGDAADDFGGGMTNRVLPEWCFQKSLEEPSLLDVHAPLAVNQDTSSEFYHNLTAEASHKTRYDIHEEEDVLELIPAAPAPMVTSATLDPMAYNAMLRRKLDVDLAAVAMWRTSRGIRRQGSHGNRASQIPNVSNNLASPNHMGDVGVHQLSSSSWERSPSDDDMEGDAETMGNINVTAAKVKKRKESNRDSARRSRSRKAAHMKELEEQVKMSEENIKRLTCRRNFPQAKSSISSLGISLSGSPLDNISNTTFPTRDNSFSYFATKTTDVGVNNNYTHELAPTPMFQFHDSSVSLHMQPPVTLDCHQTRMCGGMPSAYVPNLQWEATMLDQNEFLNMGMK
ncbi:unnamed protein product [Alopecurus aequalis]